MTKKVHTRASLLADAGIKPVEWPEGWHLWGSPDYCVSPEPWPVLANRRGGNRGRR
jgi:hypothetical protein